MTEALTIEVSPGFLDRLEKRLLREIAAGYEDWSACVSGLTAWEDAHLLDEPVATEALAAHRRTLERLLKIGAVLELSTAHSEFPDRQLAANVAATQQLLRDKLVLWHSPPMPPEQAEAILREAFGES
ncbi:MAG: hypothetical protein HYY23_16485 [Verrucomicrobia bacterium]|nr:hypothetical protein [Verrucomicrobiota bacterium]